MIRYTISVLIYCHIDLYCRSLVCIYISTHVYPVKVIIWLFMCKYDSIKDITYVCIGHKVTELHNYSITT